MTTPESIQASNQERKKLTKKIYSNLLFGDTFDRSDEEENMKRNGLGYGQSSYDDHLSLSDDTPYSSDEEADSSVQFTAYSIAKEKHDLKKRKRGPI